MDSHKFYIKYNITINIDALENNQSELYHIIKRLGDIMDNNITMMKKIKERYADDFRKHYGGVSPRLFDKYYCDLRTENYYIIREIKKLKKLRK